MYIRTFPLMLVVLYAAELRAQNKVYPGLRNLVCDAIQRADQITDMYAFALTVFGNKKAIPSAIKHGVADAFSGFTEYQFAKYNRNTQVKFRDVLRIVHPRPKCISDSNTLKKIMDDTLGVPYTWETELSKNGQLPADQQKDKGVLWAELIESRKLGYMAMLRNVRNMLEADIDLVALRKVADTISDPIAVKHSKQLPYRFLSAMDSIQETKGRLIIQNAISDALECSLENIPKLGNNVWVIVDCSMSMTSPTRLPNGKLSTRFFSPFKIASVFAAALVKAHNAANNVAVTMFSDYAKDVSVSPRDSIMTIAKQLQEKVFGGGTDLSSALKYKASLGFEPDVVIILSDMQVESLQGSNLNVFKPGTFKVAINLQAYDTTPCDSRDGWLQLGGFSDKVFTMLPALRNGENIVKVLSTPRVTLQAS
jgi:hypothetical protein